MIPEESRICIIQTKKEENLEIRQYFANDYIDYQSSSFISRLPTMPGPIELYEQKNNPATKKRTHAFKGYVCTYIEEHELEKVKQLIKDEWEDKVNFYLKLIKSIFEEREKGEPKNFQKIEAEKYHRLFYSIDKKPVDIDIPTPALFNLLYAANKSGVDGSALNSGWSEHRFEIPDIKACRNLIKRQKITIYL